MSDEKDFGVEKISEHAYSPPVGYHIIDNHTKARVGKARTRRGATNSVDKRDNAYGAYRYRAHPIYKEEEF